MYRRADLRIPGLPVVERTERRMAEKRGILRYRSQLLRIFVGGLAMISSRMRHSVLGKMSGKGREAMKIQNVYYPLAVL